MQAGPSIQLNRLELQGHSGCSLGGLLVELKNKETPPHDSGRHSVKNGTRGCGGVASNGAPTSTKTDPGHVQLTQY